MMFGDLLICGITLATFIGIHSEEVKARGHCGHYGMVKCGDELRRYRLKLCAPNVVGLKRILTVQLNTRYENRYCFRNKTPLFGISADEKTIWVMNFCYGTFFVCSKLEIEPDSQEGQIQTTDISTSTESTTQFVDVDPRNASTATDASDKPDQIGGENDTRKTLNVTKLVSQGSDTTFAQTSPSVVRAVYKDTTRNGNRNTPTMTHAPRHFVSEPGPAMDPTMKIIVIAGISTGGLVLVILICVTAYLIHTCNSNRKSQRSRPIAFKNPKLSTTELIPAEHLNDISVYDLIPCDRTNSNTIPSTVYRQTFQTFGHPEQPNNESKPITHEYFTLAPEVCKFCAPRLYKAETCVYNHTQDEGVYDRLISVPKTSVSDSSTYNHLWQFSRERKLTEDMSTQTDLTG